jgi:predicted nucleotidyltransferase
MNATIPQARLVPPINQRDRIPQAAIDDVVSQIIEKFKPIKIILFGSYAYGKPNQVSDVDILVVMNTDLRESQQEIHILKNLDFRFGLDLIVKTPQSLNHRVKLKDTFLKEIVEKGKVLYERNIS